MNVETEAILDAVDSKTRVVLRRATFISLDTDGRAVVDLDESRFSAEFTSGLIPEPGEVVTTLTIGSRVLMLGPTAAKPGRGKVTAVSASMVTVQTTTGSFEMPYLGAAPLVDDLVSVTWSEGPVCAGKLSTTPAPPPTPVDPTPPAQLRSATFYATDTGSTDRGSARWWTDQPYASTSTFGAWFYGNQIKDTIPASAEFVSLEFYVSYVQRQGGVPRFALHDAGSKGPLPGFAPYTEWDPGSGFQVPPDPAGWFNALKQGGVSAGVGLNQGGYNIFNSRARDSQSGALRIAWRA